jgi:hypothetical protein
MVLVGFGRVGGGGSGMDGWMDGWMRLCTHTYVYID